MEAITYASEIIFLYKVLFCIYTSLLRRVLNIFFFRPCLVHDVNMFCNVKVIAIFYGVRLVIRMGVPIAFIKNAKPSTNFTLEFLGEWLIT